MKEYSDSKRFIKTIQHTAEDDIIKPRVLFACINAPNYSPAGMIDGFRSLGYEVIPFDWQHIRYEIGVEDMQDRLIVKSIMEEPEIIFLHVQNKDAVDVEVAKVLSQHGFVVNFSEDVREDISWYKELAPHIGLTVLTNRDDVEEMRAYGHEALYIPTSFNHTLYKPMPKTSRNFGDIIFVGNKYVNTNLGFPKAQERQDMINFMYTHFRSHFKAHGLGQSNPMLNMSECAEAYNNSKIVITHNNFSRVGYQSDRMFNAMGCGAFTLAQYFPGCEELNLQPLAKWKNFDDLGRLCQFYLDHEKVREEIAAKNHEQVMAQHTWKNRFEYMVEAINAIKVLG